MMLGVDPNNLLALPWRERTEVRVVRSNLTLTLTLALSREREREK
jgi:hypothetical protein